MRYFSLFSGIDAASVAWKPLGWEAIAFSEIEPFPCKVLAHHYPGVPNYGDVTKFKEWPDVKNLDILVGGSPCQSFSIAGLRKGLDDPRGNLMLTYLAVVGRYKPRWVVWENVPGALSSNGGRDFGAFVGGLAQCGYGFAYRVLDAQFCRTHGHYRAVPQRRRRVFVVGHLGDWRRAAAVLFDTESLRGNPPPRRKAGEKIAPTVSGGAPFSRTGNERVEAEAMVVVVATGQSGAEITINHAPTLNCNHEQPIIAFSAKDYGNGAIKNIAPTMQSQGVNVAVAYGVGGLPDAAHCIRANASRADKPDSTTYIQDQMRARRLTPLECERLQGFPDGYTNIPGASDTARYKALGNSMAVNVMRAIGDRIKMAGRR